MKYKKEYLKAFIEQQSRLFDEPVAETIEEADEFLEECMAYVAPNYAAVKKYFEETGADTAEMNKEELLSQSEVFAMPDGKYLIVEG